MKKVTDDSKIVSFLIVLFAMTFVVSLSMVWAYMVMKLVHIMFSILPIGVTFFVKLAIVSLVLLVGLSMITEE